MSRGPPSRSAVPGQPRPLPEQGRSLQARCPFPAGSRSRSSSSSGGHGGAEEEAEPQDVPGSAGARRGPAAAAPEQEHIVRAAAAHAALAPAAAAAPPVSAARGERGHRGSPRGDANAVFPAQDEQGAGEGGRGGSPGGSAAAQLPHGCVRRVRDGRGAAQPPQRFPLGETAGVR